MSLPHRPRVLVAEDHLPLRDLLVRTLQGCGYLVGATTSCAGLRRELTSPSSRRPPVRLVVADTTLMDGSCADAVRAAREAGWRGAVVFVAPFADATEKRELRTIPGASVLDQPFDPRHLRAIALATLPVPEGGTDPGPALHPAA